MGMRRYTLDEITELGVRMHQNLDQEAEVTRGSDNWTRIRTNAGYVYLNQDQIGAVDRDASPVDAKDDKLDEWGNTFGRTRQGATQASGTSVGRIRGTAGSAYLTTDELVHPNGNSYFPTAGGTVPSAGYVDVGIISEDGGSDQILAAGEVLSFVSAPSGIEDEVELQGALEDGGEDKEANGAYRTRVLTRMSEPAMGGNFQDYVDWIIDSDDDVRYGYPWPNRNGRGSVDIGALKSGEGSARLLDSGERAAVLAYVETQRPVSVDTIRMIEITAETVDVELTLLAEFGSEYERDWDDSTPLVVSTWTAASRLLVFTTDRPASMSVGDRIIIEDTYGTQLEIESFSSTDGVVIKGPVTITPTATDEVYSGGPLIDPVREAILAHINAMGPLDEGEDERWIDTLRLTDLVKLAGGVVGVAQPTVIAPATDTSPTATVYPNDTTAAVLVPGNLVVRYV